MAFNKVANMTLSDLDKATADYNKLLELTESTYEKLYAIQDDAVELISGVESLMESISHNPLFIPTSKLKKIKTQKESFLTRKNIEREKKKDELVAGANAIAALGVAATAAIKFGDLLLEYVSKKLGSKISKNVIISIIVLIVLLIPAIVYACGQMRAQKRAAKKAEKNIEKVRKAIADLEIKQQSAEALCTKMITNYQIISQLYFNLVCYSGKHQRDIPKEQRSDFVAMLNHTLALTTLMNEKLD